MISRPSRFAFLPYLGAVFVTVFLAADVELRAATITAASVSLTDVSAAIGSANDGDTVIIPAGTATWTSQLIITNGITLMGQTTTDSVAGTAVDNTIIVSNLPSTTGNPPITINSSAGKSYRISGLTFQDARTTPTLNGRISLAGQSQAVRIDHCHFSVMPAQSICIEVADGVYGVADHNVMELAHTQPFHVDNGNAGSTDSNGNAAWAAPTKWGSTDFFFAEDNYIKNTLTEGIGFDGTYGSRFVIRHNHIYFVHIADHGTEGGVRGARAKEIYGNDFHNLFADAPAGVRSGSVLFYNNTWDGVALTTGFSMKAFRSFESTSGNRNQGWFAGDGSGPFDVNDTEGNLTYVPGHTPFLYFSGTATTGTNTTTIVVSGPSPNWQPDQWRNFAVKKTSATDTGNMSLILGNTGNVLTVDYTAGNGGSPGCTWAAGDTFEIHRVLVVLDQSGRGQGDLIAGNSTNWVNSATGTRAWPHQVLDPVYGWNNYQGTKYVPLQSPGNTFVENREFYNQAAPVGGVQTTGVGIGTLANRPATGVGGVDIAGVTPNPPGTAYWATDVASINGSTDNGALYVWRGGAWVLYYQPYTYPHPLVSGVPGAPTNLRVVN